MKILEWFYIKNTPLDLLMLLDFISVDLLFLFDIDLGFKICLYSQFRIHFCLFKNRRL